MPSDSSSLPLVVITRSVPLPDPSTAAPIIPGARVVMSTHEPQADSATLRRFVRGASVIISMFHDRIDADLLDAAGTQLRGVCNFAVGYDNIDLPACKARNVIVANCPDAVTEGTANMAWALLLACTRRLIPADRFVRSGDFSRAGSPAITDWLGLHLTAKNLLILGAGRIGYAVALRALAFGMRILYVARSRHLDFELAPLAARRVELDEGLAAADVVSIHTPLTPQTRRLLDARRLALLKPDAVLINTARGPIVDEAALADALKRNALWAAGLDVFEYEPAVHPDLLALDNVVLSPHIGSAEKYWRQVMTDIACQNALAILENRTPPNRIA